MSIVSLNDSPHLVALRSAGEALMESAHIIYMEVVEFIESAEHIEPEDKVAMGHTLSTAARIFESARAAFDAARDKAGCARAQKQLKEILGHRQVSTEKFLPDEVCTEIFEDWDRRTV